MRTQREKAPARRRLALAPLLVASLLLGACAPRPTLYQWESYQPQVYQYFKGEPKEAQVEALERDAQKIQAGGAKAPPGFHAQLGLLYSQLGKDDQMVREFTTEKALFPESTTYMDFLMKNVKRDGGQK